MIGTCHRCGVWGEVDITMVPNGGQRLYCNGCASAPPPNPPPVPGPSHLTELVIRWRDGVISPEELHELDQLVAHLHTEAAHTGDRQRATRFEEIRRELNWGPRRPDARTHQRTRS